MHHIIGDIDSLCLPRGRGRSGMMTVELCCKASTVATSIYLLTTDDWML